MFRVRPRTSGYTLLELTVIIAIIGILIGVSIAPILSYLQLLPAFQVSSDLRTIYLAQKKAVIAALSNPPSLSTTASYGNIIGLTYLTNNNFLSMGAVNDFAQPSTYVYATMPPTSSQDGSRGDALKIPGVALSGDGIYDIGPEN